MMTNAGMLGSALLLDLSVDLASRRLQMDRGWVIVLGFVALAVVLAWGAWCVSTGGSFHFSFSWLRGFTISCT